MKKKGITLIELVVAMAIFLVVVTIAVGAFVTVSRMKALTSTMKNTQQKTRIAIEMLSRLSRQAEKVTVSPDGNILTLYFDIKSTNPDAVKFALESNTLNYYSCNTMSDIDCSVWDSPTDLFGADMVIDNALSSFEKIGSIPPLLDISITSETVEQENTYYEDQIDIDTTIILESVK